jgi:hypothetical protein
MHSLGFCPGFINIGLSFCPRRGRCPHRFLFSLSCACTAQDDSETTANTLPSKLLSESAMEKSFFTCDDDAAGFAT